MKIIVMKFKHIRIVVLLGAIAIIGIVAIQAYFMQREWGNKEKQFTQTVNICLRNVAAQMYKFNQSTPSTANPVRQLSSNYFVVDINSKIDANILEHYLVNEFARYNILTDFEYSIYNCETDAMEYGNYFFYNGAVNQNAESVDLPKYNAYSYYFGVNFPKLKNTIAGDMSIWFFLIGILFVSVIFFAYSIFVILQQKRLSELQHDFINNMTHEFKTPIASITIAADVISNPVSMNEPSRILTYASVIKQEVTRLNEQVNKVLQIARIEKSGIQLRKEMLNINEIILQATRNCKTNLGEKVQISTDLFSQLPQVEGDKLHISNIFYNLLDNAVKYSGELPEIRISTEVTNSKIHIRVSDKGPGISKAHQKRIFDKFYRVPTHNIHDVKGFGLGLYYVKNICDAHRWKIYLNPSYLDGTQFIIEIG